MKEYVAPEIEIVEFVALDVIATVSVELPTEDLMDLDE